MASSAVGSDLHTLVKYGLTTKESQRQFVTTTIAKLSGQLTDITRALIFRGMHIARLEAQQAKLKEELDEASRSHQTLTADKDSVTALINRVSSLSADFAEYNANKGNPTERTSAAVARIVAIRLSLQT